jgi:hypothetical protein
MSERTPGPWRVGKPGGCIVADTPIDGGVPGTDHLEHYGGYLVAESMTEANVGYVLHVTEAHEPMREVILLLVALIDELEGTPIEFNLAVRLARATQKARNTRGMW